MFITNVHTFSLSLPHAPPLPPSLMYACVCVCVCVCMIHAPAHPGLHGVTRINESLLTTRGPQCCYSSSPVPFRWRCQATRINSQGLRVPRTEAAPSPTSPVRSSTTRHSPRPPPTITSSTYSRLPRCRCCPCPRVSQTSPNLCPLSSL